MFDDARFRQVLGHFCTGVVVVTAVDADEAVGFTAQSLTSVSLDPPLVSVCPATSSTTWPRIRAVGAFCVNILADDQEVVCRAFAKPGLGADKFAGVDWEPAPATGSPLLDGVLAWVECRLYAEHEAGDHLIALGRVLDLGAAEGKRPLLFYRGGYGRFEP